MSSFFFFYEDEYKVTKLILNIKMKKETYK